MPKYGNNYINKRPFHIMSDLLSVSSNLVPIIVSLVACIIAYLALREMRMTSKLLLETKRVQEEAKQLTMLLNESLTRLTITLKASNILNYQIGACRIDTSGGSDGLLITHPAKIEKKIYDEINKELNEMKNKTRQN